MIDTLIADCGISRRKFTNKKHKTWDGDGLLSVIGGYASLLDISGRDMGTTKCSSPFLPGSALSIGGKDVEIDSVISKQEYLAARPSKQAEPIKRTPSSEDKPVKQRPIPKTHTEYTTLNAPKRLNVAAPRSVASKAAYKNPVLSSTIMEKKQGNKPTPRHDPSATGALVMTRPQIAPNGKQIVDVVLDPILGQHLREHQREGVKFMYELSLIHI